MKKETKTLAKLFWTGLVVGALAALLGILAAGCDGSGTGELDVDGGADARPRTDTVPSTGLIRTDAGKVYCTIPSPTGDEINTGTGRTAREDAMLAAYSFKVLEKDVNVKLAEGVLGNSEDSRQVCRGMVAGVVSSTTLDAATVAAIKDADCDSIATDFRGSGGTRHCFTGYRNNNGNDTWTLLYMSFMAEEDPKPRSLGMCSKSGEFMGWVCNE